MSQFQPPPSGDRWAQWPQQPQQSFPGVQPPYAPQPAPQPPKKKRRLALILVSLSAVLIAVLVIAGVIVGSQPTPPLSTPVPTAPALSSSDLAMTAASGTLTAQANQPVSNSQPTTLATAPPVTPVPTFATFNDGTYQVGTDIKPGTYRTQTGSQGCYYARLKGFSGSTGDILANNLTDYPAIVTIFATDKGFSSQSCGTWTADLSQITTSKTTFADGMYIVGTDIAPGTYKNTASQGCYYARLLGFSNSTDDIIANNLTDGGAIVTIAASDKGFESTNCGTWTRI